MQPELSVNFYAILACVVAGMPLGFLWFGPLFGRAWAHEMGMDWEEKPQGMGKSMTLFALGNFLIAWVLAHSMQVWRPSVWGAGTDGAAWIYWINAAGWTWLGFFLPLQLGRVAWEKRGWKLVGINGSFDLTRLLVFAGILNCWR